MIDLTDDEPADGRTERREFLRGAAAASAAVLGVSTAGCTTPGRDFGGPDAAVVPDIEASVTTDSDGEGVIYQYFHTPWAEVEDDLPMLAEAGIDALWLPQPAVGKLDFQHLATEDQDGFYEPEHPDFGHLEPHPPLGYQPVDLREFDSVFGTEEELQSLVDAAHDRGIEIIVDTVLNHVANPDPAPADRWGDSDDPTETTQLEWPQFEVEEHFTEVPTYDYRGEIEDEQYDESLLGLPNLDVSHPEVQEAHEAYLRKIAEFGIDGIRFDAAAHVWPWYFAEEINPLCEELELWRVGEMWDEGDTDFLMEFVDTGMNAFDFPLYSNIVTAFEEDDLTGLAQDGGNGVVYEDPDAAVTFAQNHDTAGPGVGPGDPEGEAMALANAFILSYPGTPHLFSTDIGADLDADTQRLIDVKNRLARGALIDRHVSEGTYLYEREGNLLAGINVSQSAQSYTVETSWDEGTTLVDYTGHQPSIDVGEDGEAEVTVPARSWVMYTLGA